MQAWKISIGASKLNQGSGWQLNYGHQGWDDQSFAQVGDCVKHQHWLDKINMIIKCNDKKLGVEQDKRDVKKRKWAQLTSLAMHNPWWQGSLHREDNDENIYLFSLF